MVLIQSDVIPGAARNLALVLQRWEPEMTQQLAGKKGRARFIIAMKKAKPNPLT